MGKRDYACTPWGMPTYNLFGWQKPCYLLQDGYADTFAELMEATEWSKYGTESGNPKCANCMVHSGYEASAVDHTFSSLGGFLATVRATFSSRYEDDDALAMLDRPIQKSAHGRVGAVGNEVTNPDELEVAPGAKREQLQGSIWQVATPDELRAALEKAFDYRGDVTITRNDGTTIEGYIFDRRTGSTLADSFVRLFPKDRPEKIAISYADIAGLAFTGRDTAAGKSWEAWVKKYLEKKAAGEKQIEIVPDSLDD